MEQQDQISLRELLRLLWREKAFALSITISCTILATIFALMLPRQYEATLLARPVSNSGTGGRLAEQASSLGDLTSLIGLPIGGDAEKNEAIAVLQSRALTEQYIRENDLLPVLFASRLKAFEQKWFGARARRTPTLWEATSLFSRLRTVTEDRRTGSVTLVVRWKDPVFAAKWANDLVKLTNDDLRAQAIRVSGQHVTYLDHEAAKTDVAEVRAAIYSVLESEIKNAMLAAAPGDYALKVIDPAVPPETSSSPKIALWVVGGFAVGMLLTLGLLYLRSALRAH